MTNILRDKQSKFVMMWLVCMISLALCLHFNEHVTENEFQRHISIDAIHISLMCAEIKVLFHLGYSRQSTCKSPLPFDFYLLKSMLFELVPILMTIMLTVSV